MRHIRAYLLAASVSVLALGHASSATASGGYFVEPGNFSAVAEHRILLSRSAQSTTLVDQIAYTGAPQSFAWVLPYKFPYEVALSSDALFKNLDAATASVVLPPPLQCPPPTCGTGGAGGGGGTGGSGGGTAILAEKVVGPYETVQLAPDPFALKNWLLMYGFDIPPNIDAIIDAYIGEGFGFLAMKLVPGQKIDSMRPVRVSIQAQIRSRFSVWAPEAAIATLAGLAFLGRRN